MAVVATNGCPTTPDPVDDDDTTITQDDDDTAPDLDGDGFTEADGDCDDGDPDVHPVAEEICDGVDNDCDGSIDEGFDDYDGDGIADCVDDDCEAEPPLWDWVGIVDSCPWTGTPAEDPWDIVVEWQFDDARAFGSAVMPAVGHLTDDNGDGRIDERDTPDIVVNLLWDDDPGTDQIFALRGDGSGVIFTIPGNHDFANIAIGDIDLDGNPEVVTVWKNLLVGVYVVSYGNDGVEKWRSEFFPYDNINQTGIASAGHNHPAPSIADVDGDGIPDIVTQWAILDGLTGATKHVFLAYFGAWLDEYGGAANFQSVLADLDRDHQWEILQEDSVYSAEGGRLWDGIPYQETPSYLSSAISDLGGDDRAEVVMVNRYSMAIYQSDGEISAALPDLPNDEDQNEAAQPTIADFDGDGVMEIAVAMEYEIIVTEADGAVLWSAPEQSDLSGAAGCSAFDFDLDGDYELVCADELNLRVFDGLTGDVLFVWTDHASGTLYEYPVIADVDADGSTEIILACNTIRITAEGNCKGIAVLGHRNNAWPPAGPVWSVHDYTPFRIRPDGKVETELVAPWSIHIMFKARPPGDGLAELSLVEGERCWASCEEGPWKVTWGVLNQGWINVRDPVPVAAYRLDGDEATLLDVQWIEDLEYGYQTPGPAFKLTPDAWGDGLRIVVDDDGTGTGVVEECDEGNNALEIQAPVCP